VGTRLSAENVLSRYVKPAAEEIDCRWAGWHTLRHTCASMLFARGRNIVQVQRWLGHHAPSFTLDTYIHLLPGELTEPLELDLAPHVPVGPAMTGAELPS
jgi:integrase